MTATSSRRLVAAASACALLAAFATRRWLVPLGTGNGDEGAYAGLATLIRHGRVTVPGSSAPFFRPWLTGAHGDHFFYQYEPAWPALLAVADVIWSPTLASALAAVGVVVAVFFLAREVLGDESTARTAAVLAAVTPLFVFHSALTLSYLFSTALFATTVATGLKAVRGPSRVAEVATGASLGLLFLSRPFDAVLTGVALLAAIVVVAGRPGWVRLRSLVPAAALGALPFFVAAVLFNTRTTGSLTTFPLSASDPRNTFGFGTRGLQVGTSATDYDVSEAFRSLEENLTAAVGWLPGAFVAVALGAFALAAGRRRARWWLLGATLLFPAAYLFWWATSLSAPFATNGLGPHYYLPSFVPVLVLAADGLVRLHRRRAALAAVAVVAGLLASGWNLPDKVRHHHEVTEYFQALDDAVPDDLSNSIVVVESDAVEDFVGRSFPFLRTSADQDDDVLFAADRQGEVAELLLAHPERAAYLAHRQVAPGADLFARPWTLTKLEATSGRRVRLRVEVHRSGPQLRPVAEVDRRAVDVTMSDEERIDLVLASAADGEGDDPAVGLSPGTHDVRLGIEDAATGERWLRHYDAFVDDRGTVFALRPGLGEHVVDFGNGPVVLPEDVDRSVSDVAPR